MIAGLVAALSLLAALFAAPLVLGSYVLLEGAGRTATLLWLGLLTLLLLGALGAASLALLLTLL